MLQLHVTDDRGAVTSHLVSELPFVIGRSQQASLQLVAPGIWNEHASIELTNTNAAGRERFVITALGESLLSVNGEVLPAKELKIGDEVILGATRILVSLAPPKQKRLARQEFGVSVLLLVVVILEALVIHVAK